MNRYRRITIELLAGTLIFLVSCSFTAEKRKANDAVLLFHEQFNSENYSDIYEQAHEEFQGVTSKFEFTEYLKGIKLRMGFAKESKQRNFRIDKVLSGTFTTFTYETLFSQGTATEDFVFVVRGDRAFLYRYNVNEH